MYFMGRVILCSLREGVQGAFPMEAFFQERKVNLNMSNFRKLLILISLMHV